MKTEKRSPFNKSRINLVKKMGKKIKYEPSKQELEDAYGYLDYCNVCNKKLRFLEPYTHTLFGNHHKFGCSILARSFAYIYFPISTIIKLPFMIVIGIFEGLIWGVKALYKNLKGGKNKNGNQR